MSAAAHLYRVVQDSAGNVLAGAQVTVCNPGASSPIAEPLYADEALTTPLANPFTSGTGVVDCYLAAPKTVALKVVLGSRTLLIDNLAASANVENLLTFADRIAVGPPVAGKVLSAVDTNTLAWIDPPTTGGGGTGLNVRGVWRPGVQYHAGDLVLWKNGLYRADQDQLTPPITGVGTRSQSGSGAFSIPLPTGVQAPRVSTRGNTTYSDQDLLFVVIMVDRGPVVGGFSNSPTNAKAPAIAPGQASANSSSFGNEILNYPGDASGPSNNGLMGSVSLVSVDQGLFTDGALDIPDQGNGDFYTVLVTAFRSVGDIYVSTDRNRAIMQVVGAGLTSGSDGTIVWPSGYNPESQQTGWNSRLAMTVSTTGKFVVGSAYVQSQHAPDSSFADDTDYVYMPDVSPTASTGSLDSEQWSAELFRITELNGPDGDSYVGTWTQLADNIPLGPVTKGSNSYALGAESFAQGDGSVAIGYRARTRSNPGPSQNGDMIAIGDFAEVRADSSIAIGCYNEDFARRAIGVGVNAYVGAEGSVALGFSSYVETSHGDNSNTDPTKGGAQGSVAVGQYAGIYYPTGQYATAIGNSAESDGPCTVGIGFAAYIPRDAIGSIAIGTYSTARASGAVAIGAGLEREVGAVDFAARNVTGYINGAYASGINSIAIGGTAAAYGDATIAIGSDVNSRGSTAYDLGSIAIGGNTVARGGDVAVGLNALSSSQDTGSPGGNTAVGHDALSALTTGTNNVALGANSLRLYPTTGTGNIAIGVATGPNADASYTTSVGDSAYTDAATGSTSIGANAYTGGDYATALGNYASALFPGSVAIGTDSTGAAATTGRDDEFVLGTPKHVVQIPGTFVLTDTATGELMIISVTNGQVVASPYNPVDPSQQTGTTDNGNGTWSADITDNGNGTWTADFTDNGNGTWTG